MVYLFLTHQDELFLAALHDLRRTSQVTPIDIAVVADRLELPAESVTLIAQRLAEGERVTLRSVCAIAPTPFGASIARSVQRQQRLRAFLHLLHLQHGRIP